MPTSSNSNAISPLQNRDESKVGGSRVQKLNPLGICVTYQYKQFQVVSISVVEGANGGLIEYMVAYQIKTNKCFVCTVIWILPSHIYTHCI